MDIIKVGKYIKVETEWRGQKAIVQGQIVAISDDGRNVELDTGKIIFFDNAMATQTVVYCDDKK